VADVEGRRVDEVAVAGAERADRDEVVGDLGQQALAGPGDRPGGAVLAA
jgi:hypothetical protein